MGSLSIHQAGWTQNMYAPLSLPQSVDERKDKSRLSPARRRQLVRLTDRVQRICRRETADLPRCPSGFPALDAALGGGFVRGAVHELWAEQAGTPTCTLALLIATQALHASGHVIFIDVERNFYPPAAAQLGLPLERLILVRPSAERDALWACEESLRCDAVAAVVAPLQRLTATMTRRLQLAAETGRSLGLLPITGRVGGHSFAATRLLVESSFDPPAADDWRRFGRRAVRILFRKHRGAALSAPIELMLPGNTPAADPAAATIVDDSSPAARATGT